MTRGLSARQVEQERLCDNYEAYRELIERTLLWYVDDIPLNIDGLGATDPGALDLVDADVRLDNKYWKPDAVLVETMLAEIERGRDKLRLRTEPGRADLSDFHLPFEPDLCQVLETCMIDDTVRVRALDAKARKIVVEKATYLDQLGTNLAPLALVDAPEPTPVWRLDVLPNGRLKPFDKCRLSNTIGVAALFIDRHDVPILRYRKAGGAGVGALATMSQGWHCTSSGVLKWQDVATTHDPKERGRSFMAGLTAGMRREILEETGLPDSAYRIAPVRFARELSRAGKPQFFFLVHMDMEAIDICRQIQNPDREYDHTKSGKIYADIDAPDFLLDGRGGFLASARLRLNQDLVRRLPDLARAHDFTREAYASLYYGALANPIRWGGSAT